MADTDLLSPEVNFLNPEEDRAPIHFNSDVKEPKLIIRAPKGMSVEQLRGLFAAQATSGDAAEPQNLHQVLTAQGIKLNDALFTTNGNGEYEVASASNPKNVQKIRWIDHVTGATSAQPLHEHAQTESHTDLSHVKKRMKSIYQGTLFLLDSVINGTKDEELKNSCEALKLKVRAFYDATALIQYTNALTQYKENALNATHLDKADATKIIKPIAFPHVGSKISAQIKAIQEKQTITEKDAEKLKDLHNDLELLKLKAGVSDVGLFLQNCANALIPVLQHPELKFLAENIVSKDISKRKFNQLKKEDRNPKYLTGTQLKEIKALIGRGEQSYLATKERPHVCTIAPIPHSLRYSVVIAKPKSSYKTSRGTTLNELFPEVESVEHLPESLQFLVKETKRKLAEPERVDNIVTASSRDDITSGLRNNQDSIHVITNANGTVSKNSKVSVSSRSSHISSRAQEKGFDEKKRTELAIAAFELLMQEKAEAEVAKHIKQKKSSLTIKRPFIFTTLVTRLKDRELDDAKKKAIKQFKKNHPDGLKVKGENGQTYTVNFNIISLNNSLNYGKAFEFTGNNSFSYKKYLKLIEKEVNRQKKSEEGPDLVLKALYEELKNVLDLSLVTNYLHAYRGNRELHLAALVKVIDARIGLPDHGTCASGKDREAIRNLYMRTIECYIDSYGTPPNFSSFSILPPSVQGIINKEDQEKRANFCEIFARLYLTNHEYVLAAFSAPNAHGIKTPDLYLPTDVQDTIIKMSGNKNIFKISEVLANTNDTDKIKVCDFKNQAANMDKIKAVEVKNPEQALSSTNKSAASTKSKRFNRSVSTSALANASPNMTLANGVNSSISDLRPKTRHKRSMSAMEERRIDVTEFVTKAKCVKDQLLCELDSDKHNNLIFGALYVYKTRERLVPESMVKILKNIDFIDHLYTQYTAQKDAKSIIIEVEGKNGIDKKTKTLKPEEVLERLKEELSNFQEWGSILGAKGRSNSVIRKDCTKKVYTNLSTTLPTLFEPAAKSLTESNATESNAIVVSIMAKAACAA